MKIKIKTGDMVRVIAGKDKASEQSFRSAVYLACKILRNRKEYDELTADPLR